MQTAWRSHKYTFIFSKQAKQAKRVPGTNLNPDFQYCLGFLGFAHSFQANTWFGILHQVAFPSSIFFCFKMCSKHISFDTTNSELVTKSLKKQGKYMEPLNVILPSHYSSNIHLVANISRKSYFHQHSYHPKPNCEYFHCFSECA